MPFSVSKNLKSESSHVMGKTLSALFQNIDFHNVRELTENGDGGYTLHRFPVWVEDELSEQNIIPAALDPRVAPAVAKAVIEAAHQTGVARV